MQIIRINQSEKWNRFVRGCPDASYTHLYEWRNVIQTAYGHQSLYLAAMEENKIRAVLPLFRIKRPFGRPGWISLPFFDQAGVIGDPAAGAYLVARAGAILSAMGAASVSLRQGGQPDPANLGMEGKDPLVYDEKVAMHIPLAGSRREMMAGFRSKLRSQINKGRKNGLTWDLGKERLLDPFFRVFSRNMRDLGSPVHSKAFFKEIFKAFPGDAFICVVFHRGMPAAAGFMIRYENSLSNPWASSLKAYRHLNTNMFLYWQMIGFACNLNLIRFDMGRSSKGAPTHRFKRQWGPLERPLKWYTWAFGKETAALETLAILPWKRVPVPGANMLGPMIRKYISL